MLQSVKFEDLIHIFIDFIMLVFKYILSVSQTSDHNAFDLLEIHLAQGKSRLLHMQRIRVVVDANASPS